MEDLEYVWRFKLEKNENDCPRDTKEEPLVDFFRNNILEILKVVVFTSEDKTVHVDGYKFLSNLHTNYYLHKQNNSEEVK